MPAVWFGYLTSLAWLDVNALCLKHFGQFASFVHFTNDVTAANKFAFYIKPVSYTHLTLPTILRV